MIKILKISLLVICLTLIVAQPASAAFSSYYNTSNNIIFLDDPDAIAVCPEGSSTPFPPTTTKIDAATKTAINKLRSIYEEASKQTKVPWQIYAALDYRENTNNPSLSILDGNPFDVKATDSDAIPRSKLDSIVGKDEGFDHFKNNAKAFYEVDVTQPMNFDQLQKAFIAYNRGGSYKNAGVSPDTSPYVMNQYDATHKNMTYPNILPKPPNDKGETLRGITEISRYGAMTIYANLADAGGTSPASCFGAGVGAKVDYSSIYPALPAGTLTPDQLCTPRPSQPSFKLLKGPACDSFIVMNQAYKATFTTQLPVGDGGGYRTADAQIKCGGTVTNPGGSNPACAAYDPKNDPPEHLWGTAIDFSGPMRDPNSAEHKWLVANGPAYGWFWPNWAKNGQGGNAGVVEPWHFAYYFVGHNPASDKLESYK